MQVQVHTDDKIHGGESLERLAPVVNVACERDRNAADFRRPTRKERKIYILTLQTSIEDLLSNPE